MHEIIKDKFLEIGTSPDKRKSKLVRFNIMKSVKSKLSLEFINRLDEILFFSRLGKSHVSKIVNIELKRLKKRLETMEIFIEWDDEVNNMIALKGYSPEYGARPIKREIRNLVEDEISKKILNETIKEGSHVKITVNGELLLFNLN